MTGRRYDAEGVDVSDLPNGLGPFATRRAYESAKAASEAGPIERARVARIEAAACAAADAGRTWRREFLDPHGDRSPETTRRNLDALARAIDALVEATAGSSARKVQP